MAGQRATCHWLQLMGLSDLDCSFSSLILIQSARVWSPVHSALSGHLLSCAVKMMDERHRWPQSLDEQHSQEQLDSRWVVSPVSGFSTLTGGDGMKSLISGLWSGFGTVGQVRQDRKTKGDCARKMYCDPDLGMH